MIKGEVTQEDIDKANLACPTRDERGAGRAPYSCIMLQALNRMGYEVEAAGFSSIRLKEGKHLHLSTATSKKVHHWVETGEAKPFKFAAKEYGK